ncbi:MAG TPA: glucose-6-phosphate isomerase, partial [Intrasporangium sp.]|nr:glucose-6-phosphate isomerase [Intrasporangium sp.]
WPASDVLVARLVAADDETRPSGDSVRVGGTLGAQLLLWEAAIAVSGRLLGINPFDQPDVESAKQAARGLLEDATGEGTPPALVDGAVEVRALGGDWLGRAATVDEAVEALLGQLGERGYVAVMAYLDRLEDAQLADCRRELAKRTERPTTFGWGPRFLHSTGQFHKGGPPVGVYLQITSAPHEDLRVPGRDFTFGQFIAAQAGGDAQVLADHGRPVLRLHLVEHDGALAQVSKAVGAGGLG